MNRTITGFDYTTNDRAWRAWEAVCLLSFLAAWLERRPAPAAA